jgi:ketosteroid isomerase-like protein
MTEHSLWRFSRASHEAINDGDLAALADVLDDDIDWAVYGPIDMFPFLGQRRGKAAVLEVYRHLNDNVQIRRFDRESVMLGQDQASSLVRYSLTGRDASRAISLRAATFLQFKRGRLTSLRGLLDTFDLVEQALGHPLHLPQAV